MTFGPIRRPAVFFSQICLDRERAALTAQPHPRLHTEAAAERIGTGGHYLTEVGRLGQLPRQLLHGRSVGIGRPQCDHLHAQA